MSIALRLLVFAVFAFYSSVFAEPYRWDSLKIGGAGFVTGIITSKSEPDLRYARTDVGGAYRWDEDSGEWIPLLDWVSEVDKGYLAVESLAIDEQSPNKVYMLVGIEYFSGGRTAILRSSDYGETFDVIEVTSQFRAHGNGNGRQNGERLVVDPNNGDILYCGTRRSGLFKSVDAGVTWSHLDTPAVTTTSNGNGICLVVVDPDSLGDGISQTIFVGVSRTGENLYRSDDGGQTFGAVSGGPTQQMPMRAVLASDGDLYIAYSDREGPGAPASSGGIWKYDTVELNWANVTPAGFSSPFAGISVDPANPDRLIASTTNTWLPQGPGQYADRFFLTVDGGNNWTDLVEQGYDVDPNGVTWLEDKDQSIHWAGSIEFDPFDTSRAFVVSGNGLYRADDVNASTVVWTSNVEGLEETVPLGLVSIKDGPVLSVIGDYDGFRHTDLSEYAPIHRPRMGTTTGLAVAGSNPGVVLRVGGSMYYSEDMGISWTATGAMNGSGGQVSVSADGGVFLHCPDNSSTTYRSTDRGTTWTTVSGLGVNEARPIADPVNANKFYAYGGSSMYASTDGGASFSAVGSLASNGSKIVRTVLGKEGHLWIALYGGGLSRSINSGSSFSSITGVTYCAAVGVGKAAEAASYPTLYIWGTVGGVTGLFRSIDEGANWVRINDDSHQYGGPGNGQFVVGDENVFGRVYMSTVGRGVVYGQIGDSISYADWVDRMFDESQRGDGAISAESADPDGDGLSNLLEWALQTDPLESTSLASRMLAISGSGMELIVQQLAELSTATLTVEVSVDLQVWAPLEDLFVEAGSEVSNDSLVLTKTYSAIGESSPATLFIRVSAER